MSFIITDLEETQLGKAARLWQLGWHDAHSAIVPSELVKLRTPESFVQTLTDRITAVRVCVEDSVVLGLYITKDDELYQLYVAPQARGTGLAQALMVDAENNLARAGYELTWLACAFGNKRAARFYDKAGWSNVGIRTIDLETTNGAFPLKIWRYEKRFL